MLFVVLKTPLKFPVSGIKCETSTTEMKGTPMEGLVLLCIYLLSESHAISHIRHLQGVAPPVNAVSPLCHVSAQLTTHTSR